MQLRIEACDTAFPSICGQTVQTINVVRNVAPPAFATATLQVPETTDPTTWSFVINASDPDSVRAYKHLVE